MSFAMLAVDPVKIADMASATVTIGAVVDGGEALGHPRVRK
jgi:hypothetical protein